MQSGIRYGILYLLVGHTAHHVRQIEVIREQEESGIRYRRDHHHRRGARAQLHVGLPSGPPGQPLVLRHRGRSRHRGVRQDALRGRQPAHVDRAVVRDGSAEGGSQDPACGGARGQAPGARDQGAGSHRAGAGQGHGARGQGDGAPRGGTG